MTNLQPALVLVVSGAPLTARVVDLAQEHQADGWAVQVVATSSAVDWIDAGAVDAAGLDVRTDYRHPSTAKQPRTPAVLVVAPATFNLINKWAAGISDNYAMGVVNEALGAGVPTVAVPFVNESLWKHPVFSSSLATLVTAGVILVDPNSGEREPAPVGHGTGRSVAELFDPAWVMAAVQGAVRGE